MLLVRNSMTREVVTVGPEATAAEALALCRERRIRHVPVVEGGRLVGIISDRDLRSATPALGDPDRTAALERITVGDVMARDIVTARPDDPIEHAAMAMYEKKIGCLPVVDGDALVGILTASDVMKAFVQLVGAHEPGSRVEVSLPDRPGALAGVADVLREEGVNLVSVLASPEPERGRDGAPRRVVVLRIGTMNTRGVVESLRGAGHEVLWPPDPDEGSGRAS